VAPERLEEARALLVELFPEGFEEIDRDDGVELAVYSSDEGRRRRLADAFGTVESSVVGDDWPDRWREFHRPARVGPLWIGPPWEDVPDGALAIVIDPGRAFGTGAHATTRLCVELLLGAPRGSLLDVGCGSGVLAIAAARLGFAPVIALDADPAAVDAAAENAERNGIAIDVRRADALADPLPAADVAVANIELAVVERLAPRLECSHLVTSGYLSSDTPSLPGFECARRIESDGWSAEIARRA
jgi:ribosomal protein L11 methyltransferase